MRLQRILIPAVASVALLLMGCDLAYQQATQAALGVPMRLSEDADIRAAAASRAAADNERQARAHLREGLRNQDVSAVERAIVRRPADPTYYAYKAAMLFVQSGAYDIYRPGFNDLHAVLRNNSGTAENTDATKLAAGSHLLIAASELRLLYPANSDEAKRAQQLYCSVRGSLLRLNTPLAEPLLALNPGEGCP